MIPPVALTSSYIYNIIHLDKEIYKTINISLRTQKKCLNVYYMNMRNHDVNFAQSAVIKIGHAPKYFIFLISITLFSVLV